MNLNSPKNNGAIPKVIDSETGQVPKANPVDAVASPGDKLNSLMNQLGITTGRIIVEYACIAFAPGDKSLTPTEVLTDAQLRSELTSQPMSESERIFLLQERYRILEGTERPARIEVTAASKLSALAMLAEFMEMRRMRWNRLAAARARGVKAAVNESANWTTEIPQAEQKAG